VKVSSLLRFKDSDHLRFKRSCHPEPSLARFLRQTKSKDLLFLFQPRIFLLAVALALPLSSHAQGCSLCKDVTAGSAPHQRQALRRAILIMGIPAGALFLGTLVLAGKIKPREDSDLPNQL
jgi:hypothetical protein